MGNNTNYLSISEIEKKPKTTDSWSNSTNSSKILVNKIYKANYDFLTSSLTPIKPKRAHNIKSQIETDDTFKSSIISVNQFKSTKNTSMFT